MVQTGVDICNLAIERQGAETIDQFNEDTPISVFCATTYPQKRLWLLAKHRWVFATRLVQLTRRTVTPAGCPATYAFDRPGDVVGAFHAFREGPRREDRRVHPYPLKDFVAADAATVWAEYTADVPENQWPPWFVELAVVAFQADLARKLGNDQAAYELNSRAFGPPSERSQGGLFAEAQQEDGRNAPERTMGGYDDGPLINARYGGFGPCGLTWTGETIDF